MMKRRYGWIMGVMMLALVACDEGPGASVTDGPGNGPGPGPECPDCGGGSGGGGGGGGGSGFGINQPPPGQNPITAKTAHIVVPAGEEFEVHTVDFEPATVYLSGQNKKTMAPIHITAYQIKKKASLLNKVKKMVSDSVVTVTPYKEIVTVKADKGISLTKEEAKLIMSKNKLDTMGLQYNPYDPVLDSLVYIASDADGMGHLMARDMEGNLTELYKAKGLGFGGQLPAVGAPLILKSDEGLLGFDRKTKTAKLLMKDGTFLGHWGKYGGDYVYVSMKDGTKMIASVDLSKTFPLPKAGIGDRRFFNDPDELVFLDTVASSSALTILNLKDGSSKSIASKTKIGSAGLFDRGPNYYLLLNAQGEVLKFKTDGTVETLADLKLPPNGFLILGLNKATNRLLLRNSKNELMLISTSDWKVLDTVAAQSVQVVDLGLGPVLWPFSLVLTKAADGKSTSLGLVGGDYVAGISGDKIVPIDLGSIPMVEGGVSVFVTDPASDKAREKAVVEDVKEEIKEGPAPGISGIFQGQTVSVPKDKTIEKDIEIKSEVGLVSVDMMCAGDIQIKGDPIFNKEKNKNLYASKIQISNVTISGVCMIASEDALGQKTSATFVVTPQ